MRTKIPEWYTPGTTIKIMFVGEAPGTDEVLYGEPFYGAAGRELKKWCQEVGINWKDCVLANVVEHQPVENKFESITLARSEVTEYQTVEVYRNRFLHPRLYSHVERLRNEIASLKPTLVVALGAVPMAVLTGNLGIGKSRGTVTPCSLVPGVKVLGTYHPANVLRNWKNRPIALMDLLKAKRECEFPDIRRPQRWVMIEPTLEDVRDFVRKAIAESRRVAVDIETAHGCITCIGFAVDHESAIVIPFVDKRKPGYSYWATKEEEIEAWRLVQELLESPCSKVGQNGTYDIQWLAQPALQIRTGQISREEILRLLGVGLNVRHYDHDTMLLHHALYPEMQKSLGFLGSIYTDEASWKLYAPRRYGKTSKLEDE